MALALSAQERYLILDTPYKNRQLFEPRFTKTEAALFKLC